MEERLPRKLAAVLHADIVGYSRLVGMDEDATHRKLKEAMGLFSRNVESHGGQVVKYVGDAVLARFDAAADALLCALSVQRELESFNRESPVDRHILFRIGINLGDIIEDSGDIFGDGVNIAARLEGLADPGGICVSETVYMATRNKLPIDYRDMGLQTVKNIEESIRTFSVSVSDDTALPTPLNPGKTGKTSTFRHHWWLVSAVLLVVILSAGLYTWTQTDNTDNKDGNRQGAVDVAKVDRDMPAIAVLPFDNLSNDPEQQYFSDGISEDIITDLSRLSQLGVIARNSSFSFRDSADSIQEISDSLRVDYVLQGSVRKSGERLRISAQLVDTASGHSMWAERYDRQLRDIFELQDEITGKIVSALSVELIGAEAEHLVQRETSSFEAYDTYLRGREFFNQFTPEGMNQAERLYRQAIELDPNFARAYGSLGVTLVRRMQIDFSIRNTPDDLFGQAVEMVEKAVALDPYSPQSQWAYGFVFMVGRQFEEAAQAVEKAVRLSPNYADGWGLLSLINNNLGHADQALRFIRKAMALNPAYSWDYPYNEGRALYTLREYEQSLPPLLEALERNENSLLPRLFLAASYVRLGLMEEANWEISEIEISHPGITLSRFDERIPMAEGEHKTRLFADLEQAGLPE